MGNKGQTLVETLLVLPLLILLTTCMLIIFNISFSYFYAHYHLHEATFCSLSYPLQYCKVVLSKRLKVLRFIKINNITLERHSTTTSGSLELILITNTPVLKLKPIKIRKTVENYQWI